MLRHKLQPQLKKSDSQIDVRMPMARTTHQPARASHIVNAPPRIHPVTGSQNMDEERMSSAITSPRMTPVETKAIPSFKRKALPAAPMLQVNAMRNAFVCSISTNVFLTNLFKHNPFLPLSSIQRVSDRPLTNDQ